MACYDASNMATIPQSDPCLQVIKSREALGKEDPQHVISLSAGWLGTCALCLKALVAFEGLDSSMHLVNQNFTRVVTPLPSES